MGLTLLTGPTVLPLSLAEVKSHLRVDTTDDEEYIQSLISVVAADCEQWLNRCLITQTWVETFLAFPVQYDFLELEKSPLQSVTSVQYVDTDGVTQTFSADDYEIDLAGTPGSIYLGYGKSFPSTRSVRDAVTVTYVAGYGDAETDVPVGIRHGMKIMLSHLYENREPVVTGTIVTRIPMSFESLLGPYRDERFR